MSRIYYVIPKLRARNVNALPAWWLIGAPGPMAILGFAHALARHCGLAGTPDTAIVHHDFSLIAERQINDLEIEWQPHQFRGASLVDKDDYVKRSMNLALQPSVRGELCVSLVLSVDSSTPIDTDHIEDFLFNGRLAGGSILSWGKIRKVDDGAAAAIRSTGSGFLVVERSDLLNASEVGDEGLDNLDLLLKHTRHKNLRYLLDGVEQDASVEGEGSTEQARDTWLLPAHLGYAAISEIEHRDGVREGHLHAFAEPLIGLIQYLSLRKTQIEELVDGAFWRFSKEHAPSGVFVATTKHFA